MMITGFLLIFVFVTIQEGVSQKTTADRIYEFGYPAEIHTLTTKDGYVLNIFRIKSPSSKSFFQRPVVLLMHGLISSSDCWILNGRRDALAFNLIDSGYDVWLGNSRGTPYGFHHISLSPKQRRFWRFSIHELGTIDLPHTIDYILENTGQSQLHYVGHSQGTTILLILLSTQPEYNRQIKTGHLLAPIAFMEHAQMRLLQYLSSLFLYYTPLNRIVGERPLLQTRLVRQALGLEYCSQRQADPDLCSQLLFGISGGYSAYFNMSLLYDVFNTQPASCSVQQLIHLAQLHISGHFQAYNYGIAGNLLRYGLTHPPKYKVTNINIRHPLNLYYSDYDELSAKADVDRLSRIMGNRTVRHFIDRRYFAHIDFLWSSIVREDINKRILRIMYEAEVYP